MNKNNCSFDDWYDELLRVSRINNLNNLVSASETHKSFWESWYNDGFSPRYSYYAAWNLIRVVDVERLSVIACRMKHSIGYDCNYWNDTEELRREFTQVIGFSPICFISDIMIHLTNILNGEFIPRKDFTFRPWDVDSMVEEFLGWYA